MIGQKFNMLTVLEECNERDKRNNIILTYNGKNTNVNTMGK